MAHRAPVTPADIGHALAHFERALEAHADRDWLVKAGVLTWTCRRTAVHFADCLLAYSAQLVAEPADHWVPMTVGAPHTASNAQVMELVRASGGILQATARDARPGGRAWHPYGVSDPEGFCAMAVTEVLIHGSDIAQGLSVPFDAPDDLCNRTLARLFPELETDGDPWSLLRWAAGRTALEGRPRRRSWRWRGQPPD